MMVDIWKKAFFAQPQCQIKSMWLRIDNLDTKISEQVKACSLVPSIEALRLQWQWVFIHSCITSTYLNMHVASTQHM